jgi:hypothetical protein
MPYSGQLYLAAFIHVIDALEMPYNTKGRV